jgi:hypothetical protein
MSRNIKKELQGKTYFTAGKIINELSHYNPDEVVLAIGTFAGNFVECPIYKMGEDADEEELYLYMGDPITSKNISQIGIHPRHLFVSTASEEENAK